MKSVFWSQVKGAVTGLFKGTARGLLMGAIGGVIAAAAVTFIAPALGIGGAAATLMGGAAPYTFAALENAVVSMLPLGLVISGTVGGAFGAIAGASKGAGEAQRDNAILARGQGQSNGLSLARAPSLQAAMHMAPANQGPAGGWANKVRPSGEQRLDPAALAERMAAARSAAAESAKA